GQARRPLRHRGGRRAGRCSRDHRAAARSPGPLVGYLEEIRGGLRVSQRIGVEVAADPGPGILHQLSGVIAREQGNILSIEIVEEKSPETVTYFEIDIPGDPQQLLQGLRTLPVVHRVELVQTMQKI